MKRLAARDGKPVPYGKSVLAINLRSKIIPNSEFNNAYHALLMMYSAIFLGVMPSFSRSSSGL